MSMETRKERPSRSKEVDVLPIKRDAHSAPEIELVTDAMSAYWVPRINTIIVNCAEGWVQLGRELIEAKAKLGHGQWQALFRSGEVQLDLRVAQRLMAVARHEALAKTTNSSFLPPSPDALYALSKLPPPEIETYIVDRQITPTMTIAEARALGRPERPPAEPDFDSLVENLTPYLQRKLANVPQDLLRLVVHELVAVLNGLLPAKNQDTKYEA
jgi:hypothetical protein